MRAFVCVLLFCACKTPIADRGGEVPVTATATAGALVITNCTDPLRGDAHGVTPLYLVDPSSGAVRRWLPPDYRGALNQFRASANTPALFYLEEKEGPPQTFHAELRSLSPSGKVELVDANPGRGNYLVAGDGRHRMIAADASLEWRALDGKLEKTLQAPALIGRFFPSEDGARALLQLDEGIQLVSEHGTTGLVEKIQLIAAAWHGRAFAFVATADHESAGLWIARDGGAPNPVGLPVRRQDLLSRWLDRPGPPTAPIAVAWSPDGDSLYLLSNHESECWSGGRDIPSGCERAPYRLSLDGKLTRVSPRAFACNSLFVISG